MLRFTEAVSSECKVDRNTLIAIWNKVAPDCTLDLKLVIERENKKKELETKKLQKKESELRGPHCQYVWKKAKRPDEVCGDFCKDGAPAEDGKLYCGKHRKQIGSKATLASSSLARSKQLGNVCGSRIAKDGVIFDREGEHEDHDYCNKWLCKKHITQVEKALDRKDNQCQHIFGEKSKKEGEQCTSKAVDGGDRCKKHQAGAKKDQVKKSAAKLTKAKDGDEEKVVVHRGCGAAEKAAREEG